MGITRVRRGQATLPLSTFQHSWRRGVWNARSHSELRDVQLAEVVGWRFARLAQTHFKVQSWSLIMLIAENIGVKRLSAIRQWGSKTMLSPATCSYVHIV